MLVSRAVDQRVEPRTRPDVESADALRGMELVSGHGQQVHIELVDVDRDLAHRLRRIGMAGDPILARNGGDVDDRLERADLVVGVRDVM
jgi:hypothetical protein